MGWRRGQAYGQDLRDRVLACPDLTLVEVAARFSVSPSYVSKVRARLRVLGDASPGPQHNHVPPRLAPLTDAVRDQVAANPDAKLREVRAWLVEAHGVQVSHPVLWRAVARLGLTHKKTPARGRAGPRGRGRGA
jgi:transposase